MERQTEGHFSVTCTVRSFSETVKKNSSKRVKTCCQSFKVLH